MYYSQASRSGRRRSPIGCIVPLIIVAIIGVVGYYGYNYYQTNFVNPTFTVKAHPTIIVDNATGFVRVDAGKSNYTVNVTENSQNSDTSGNISNTQDNGNNTITIQNADNLTLTVPANSDLKIDTTNIQIIGINGQMNLITNGGSITVLQSRLSSQSSINSNGGNITFNGTLDPQGVYKIDANGGSVDLTMPQNTAFHLDMTGILGPVVSTFPAIQNRPTSISSNNDLHADIGNSPRAQLTVHVNDTQVIIKS